MLGAPMNVVEQLRQLEQAATPGPWKRGPDDTWFIVADTVDLPGGPGNEFSVMAEAVTYEGCCSGANAELIAAARNALPALLDAVGAAREFRWATSRTQRERARREFDAALSWLGTEVQP